MLYCGKTYKPAVVKRICPTGHVNRRRWKRQASDSHSEPRSVLHTCAHNTKWKEWFADPS